MAEARKPDIYVLFNDDGKEGQVRESVGLYVDALKSVLHKKLNDRPDNNFTDNVNPVFAHYDKGLYGQGQGNNESIARESSILLAFFPALLDSDECRAIWDAFWRLQRRTRHRIIYSIDMGTLDMEGAYGDVINSSRYEIFENARQFDFYKGKGNSFDVKNQQSELADEISRWKGWSELRGKNTVEIVSDRIDEIEGDEGFAEIRKVVKRKIEDAKKRAEAKGQKIEMEHEPVCVIYTGGTVGLIRKNKGDPSSAFEQATLEDLEQNIPRMNDLGYFIHLYSYKELLDSSNIESSHWLKLAEIIDNLYDLYQGFVIVHGANTMAYTASALSFMFSKLDKPIVLTGAELPLSEINSDAEKNVLYALDVAAHKTKNNGNVHEVCVLYGRTLVRGNRATKKYSLDTYDGFYSPNCYPLADINRDRIMPNLGLLSEDRKGYDGVELKMDESRGILVYDICPDMDVGLFEYICDYGLMKNGRRHTKQGLKAIILRTYGTGGIPNRNTRFINALKRFLGHKDTLVINLTQCPMGSVELRLHETNKELFDMGVINGGDMVLEAAYCKLKYLFAKYDSNDEEETINHVKKEMIRNIRGEMSMNTYIITFTNNRNERVPKGGGWSPSFELRGMPEIINGDRVQFITLSVDGVHFDEDCYTIRKNDEKGVAVSNNSIAITFADGKSAERVLGIYRATFPATGYSPFSFNVDITNSAKDLIHKVKSIQIMSRHHGFAFNKISIVITERV